MTHCFPLDNPSTGMFSPDARQRYLPCRASVIGHDNFASHPALRSQKSWYQPASGSLGKASVVFLGMSSSTFRDGDGVKSWHAEQNKIHAYIPWPSAIAAHLRPVMANRGAYCIRRCRRRHRCHRYVHIWCAVVTGKSRKEFLVDHHIINGQASVSPIAH